MRIYITIIVIALIAAGAWTSVQFAKMKADSKENTSITSSSSSTSSMVDSENPPQTSSTQNPSASNNPTTPSSSKTLTYSNGTYNFTFQYPAAFKYKNEDSSTYAAFTNYVVPETGSSYFPAGQNKLEIYVRDSVSSNPDAEVVMIADKAAMREKGPNPKYISYGVKIPGYTSKYLYIVVFGDSANYIPTMETIIKSLTFTSTQKTVSYSNYNNGKIGFEYPSSWGAPKMTQLSTRVMGKFSNDTTFESGIYYNQATGKNNTVQDLVAAYSSYSAVKNLKTASYTVNGIAVTKVTYTGAEGIKLMVAYFSIDKNGEIFMISADENKVTPAEFEQLIGSVSIVK